MTFIPTRLKNIAGTIALATAFLTSCSAPKNPNVIEIATFGDSTGIQVLNSLLDTFNKREHIKAKAVYIAWKEYNTKIITQLASGKAPEVIWVEVGPYVPLQFAGALDPLDDLIARDMVDLKAFYPAVLERFSKDNHIYALPQDTAPIACLYYNKKYFREAGLKYPDANWSWADFLNAAKKLTKKDAEGKTKVWGFRDAYAPDWVNMIYGNGGLLVDDWKNPKRCVIDSPQAIEGVQFLTDMINLHKCTPGSADTSSVGGTGIDMFGAGQVAMSRCGYWPVATLRAFKDLDWDIAPFPKGPKAKTFRWSTGGSGWAMTKNVKDREKAWKVLKYLASAEVQRASASSGYTQPAIMSLVSSKEFLNSDKPDNKKMMITAPNYAIYSPAHPRWDEALESIIGPKMDTVFLGKRTAADVLKEVAAEVNAKILNSKD